MTAQGVEWGMAVLSEGRVIARVQDMGMPAVVCDPHGHLLAANEEALAKVGAWGENGAHITDLALKTEEGEDLERLWTENCRDRNGWSHEVHVTAKDGALIDLHLVAIPIWVSGEPEDAWLVVVEDLTQTLLHARQLEVYAQELSQLYQENRRQVQRLEEAERSRDRFFSLVSHELKTPLTSLKASLELLNSPDAKAAGPEGIWRLVSGMTRSTERLERMITDLLDLAVAQSGGLSLEFEVVDLLETVQNVLEEMTPLATEKQLSVHVRKGRLKSLVVWGDGVRLQQMVQNLFSNAVKAAPVGGEVRVGVSRDAGMATVRVVNPGVALDPEVRKTLFQPFTKSATDGYKAGAGLGLSVVQALVQAHGGSITVLPGEQQTAFSFTIPLGRKDGQHANTRS